MYYYKIYGLTVRSDLAFKGLQPIKKEASDVTINLNKFDRDYSLKIARNRNFWRDNNDFFVFFEDIGLFKIHDGREITIAFAPEANEYLLQQFILGNIFAILLHQRGYLILHGSSVNLRENAIAFIGYSGSGKSTTSLMLKINNYPVLSDDIVPITFDGKKIPFQYSTFPETKISEDVNQFLKDCELLNDIHFTKLDENYYFINKDYIQQKLPVKMIYVVEKSDRLSIETLKPQEGLVNLIRHSYMNHFFSASEQSHNLMQCQYLMNKVVIKRLRTGNSLIKLSELVQMIEEDVLNEI